MIDNTASHGHFLAMDLGGTKIEAAYARVEEGHVQSLTATRLDTAAFSDLETVIGASCQQLGVAHPQHIGGVAVAVAGPVVSGRAQLTNIPWAVAEDQLKGCFPKARTVLMNDMQAHGFAAVALMAEARGRHIPKDILVSATSLMDTPLRTEGTACVVAPGTGLGEGFVAWTGDEHLPMPSEGGHSSFAPINEEQMRLLTFLRQEQGHHHVSWERVLSGKFGLPNLYLFATRVLELRPISDELEAKVVRGDRPVQALLSADQQGDPVAHKVLEMFIALMGQEAGNLALSVLATGGIFISGGLSHRMKDAIKGPYLTAFLEGLCSKGRFRDMLSSLPVQFLEDKDTAMKGALASLWL